MEIVEALLLNHISLCEAIKLRFLWYMQVMYFSYIFINHIDLVSLTYVVNLGWRARSASRVDFSMFAGCKNAWKHSITMAHQWAIIYSNWGLLGVCIQYNGACLVCSSLWLSGLFLSDWIYFFLFSWMFCHEDVLKLTMYFVLQEIGVLVTLFCLFHACAGLILPSLAKLRTTYVE